MPVAVICQEICFVRLQLTPSEIPGLLARHALAYPGAVTREREAADLVETGFKTDASCAFIEAVVRWGGGQRFVGRLLAQNSAEQIMMALRDAYDLLGSGRASDAVLRLQRLRYLGQSFGSKVARFLSPTTAVILDDVIRGALGYRESADGYQEFLDDCRAVLAMLAPSHPDLRICDVEAAIFAKIQEY